MKNRAAVIAAALAVSVLAAGCAGSASPRMTSSPAGTTIATSRSMPTQPTTGAPITVLPPSTTAEVTARNAATTTAQTTTASSTPKESTPTESTPTAPATTTFATSTPAPTTVPTGTVVVIDPGHNGGNASHPEIINKQVPAGFGQYKACNTTGTATNAGYPEHEFNWQVALKLRDLLQAKGITVRMTRDSDSGVGPCVNQRAAVGNDARAAAVISIHGDGEAAGVTGFFVMTASRPPAGPDIAAATTKLADHIRDGMVASGLSVNSALGKNGLWARSDLGGLNLSLRPTVMIECGNMRNATEAARMSSAAGQQRYADAIAVGVLAYLGA